MCEQLGRLADVVSALVACREQSLEVGTEILLLVEASLALGDVCAARVGSATERVVVAERRRGVVDTHALVGAGAVRPRRLSASHHAQVTVAVLTSIPYAAGHLTFAPVGQPGERNSGTQQKQTAKPRPYHASTGIQVC